MSEISNCGGGKTLASLLAGAVLLLNCASPAKTHRKQADNTPGSFDYYLLTLSWAPEFALPTRAMLPPASVIRRITSASSYTACGRRTRTAPIPNTAVRHNPYRKISFARCCRSCRIPA